MFHTIILGGEGVCLPLNWIQVGCELGCSSPFGSANGSTFPHSTSPCWKIIPQNLTQHSLYFCFSVPPTHSYTLWGRDPSPPLNTRCWCPPGKHTTDAGPTHLLRRSDPHVSAEPRAGQGGSDHSSSNQGPAMPLAAFAACPLWLSKPSLLPSLPKNRLRTYR